MDMGSCSSRMARDTKPTSLANRLTYSYGLAGLLVPDIPLEETGPVREVATAAGLELVLLTTPTTPLERMEAIAKVSQGFVYLVSVTGRVPLHTALPPQNLWTLSSARNYSE